MSKAPAKPPIDRAARDSIWPARSYEIGYGKPPKPTQFVKGQSGNPHGRPRKPKVPKHSPQKFRDGQITNLLEAEAFRSLQLNENGRPIEMSAVQAILRSLMADGIKGNRLAKRHVFELLRREEDVARERRSDAYNYYAKLKSERTAELARYRNENKTPPRQLPHPDDILLDETTLEVHILGPTSADEAIPFERGALVRDLFHAMHVLEDKYGEAPPIEDESVPRFGVFASIVDRALPPSLQRETNEPALISYLMELSRLSKRKLKAHITSLLTQIANMPPTIEEKLARRRRAADILASLGQGMEDAALEYGKRVTAPPSTSSADARRSEKALDPPPSGTD
jgi:hypothetical protein